MTKLIALSAVALLIFGSAVMMHLVMAPALQVRPDMQSDYVMPASRQSQRAEDLDLATGIRNEIQKDPSLVTAPLDYRVITRNGEVTLRGPVKTQLEKDTIARIAKHIAPSSKVINELIVAPGL